MHKIKVTVTIDGELEYEYERTIDTDEETRKLVDGVHLALLEEVAAT